ncbi:MAG TPA: Arc family DNA-binding protein [Candidatus Acidoferrales bacterium]|nr:Arc family DNA-binding protein [Candidatus Acidoferrales bacterium]
MAQLIVRNIPNEVKERLRRRAKRHGQSMEAEVRDILRDATKNEPPRKKGLGTEIAELFRGIGLEPGEEFAKLPEIVLQTPDFEK